MSDPTNPTDAVRGELEQIAHQLVKLDDRDRVLAVLLALLLVAALGNLAAGLAGGWGYQRRWRALRDWYALIDRARPEPARAAPAAPGLRLVDGEQS